MSEPFGPGYSNSYDLLYQEKDYEAECDLIEQAGGVASSPRTILDLGCGTAEHAIVLAKRGHRVCGIDRSATMLEVAREKAVSAGVEVDLQQGDIRQVRLDERFDLVISMFAVLGYQLTNDDVLAALRTAREHLAEGGRFLFDVWFGPAVLAVRPSQRVRVIDDSGSKVIRISEGILRPLEQTCQVEMRVLRPKDDDLEEVSETHVMRYFFPKELELFLTAAGFEPLSFSSFPDIEEDPGLDTWNLFVAARAI